MVASLIEYAVVSKESMDEFEGPYEVDAGIVPEYAALDHTDHVAMKWFAKALNSHFDGDYVVVTRAEMEAARAR